MAVTTITMSVDIDLDDLADELDDAQFDYLADAFSCSPAAKQVAISAINDIRAGRFADAITTLEREFLPKWKDKESCQAEYSRRVAT